MDFLYFIIGGVFGAGCMFAVAMHYVDTKRKRVED